MPRKYGDKITQELVGDTEQPIVTRIELVAVYPPARDGGDEAMVTPLRALPSR